MEQVFKHYDKDSLKVAMLKHEETFRQQVHELHRLYRIQKLLMRDLKRELKRQRNLSTSPNGSTQYNRSALDVCSYEQWYGATRGSRAATAPRTALSLDFTPAVEYAQSAEEDAEETDDETELELTLAVGSGAAFAKKRYNNEHSPGESISSSSTESDVLIGGREWQAPHGAGVGSPYHKRRPAGFDVVQVESDGGVQQPPVLFHWLSLRMA